MRRSLIRFGLLVAVLAGAFAVSAAAAPTLTEWELPTKDREPNGIALGPEGNVWFTESAGAGAIGRITPEGTITEFTSGLTPASKPTGISAGPDGNLWFTEAANPGRIGRITPAGVITEFSTGLTSNSQPTGITAGPDGNLWFTEAANPGRIGRITTAGVITEFSTGLTANRAPSAITAGPDGNLWFTESGGSGAIGRITTSGTITEFTSGLTSGAHPSGITVGPDGNLWFTETAASGRIGRITVGGSITEFSSGLTPGSEPEGIAPGNDGALYFTEAKNPGRIGRITTGGAITETATTTNNSQPLHIATGGDGNLWFSEAGAHGLIGKLTVAPGVSPGTSTSAETNAVLKALVGPNSQASTYRFEYGPTSAYGSLTSWSSAGSGSSLAPVAASIEGLSPASTYHFRVVAINASGTTYGSDQTVTTTRPPGAATLPAGSVTLGAATLHASVEPHGQVTTYRFEWGTSATYGNEAPVGGAEAGSDQLAHALAAKIESLSPNTVYHFRVVATNCGGCAEGTTFGADQTFTTAAPPAVSTSAAGAVSRTSATLAGSVDPRGAVAGYRFEWGETAAYGSQSAWTRLGATSGLQGVAEQLTGLQPGRVYHFRLVATNCEGCEAGTSYGADMVLVTQAPVIAPITSSPLTSVTPGPAGPPAVGRTALLHVLSGTVTIRTSAGKSLALSAPADIPVGSTVDTRHGSLELTTAIDARGDVQSASVWGGVFTVGQSAHGGGMTTMSVPRATGCGRASRSAAVLAHSAAHKSSETLWAHDNHGRFSTRGHNSVATVRGTYWGTTESCAGTRTIVRKGAVSVRSRSGRTVLVRAGHSYLARS